MESYLNTTARIWYTLPLRIADTLQRIRYEALRFDTPLDSAQVETFQFK